MANVSNDAKTAVADAGREVRSWGASNWRTVATITFGLGVIVGCVLMCAL